MFGGTVSRGIVAGLVGVWLPVSIFTQAASPATKQARGDASTSPAPQVVTIVHRLNGLKMFRLLLRSQEQVEAIANLDDDFNFTGDVHTNIIAGLAMEDGRTIAAWLPDADVEFGPSLFAPLAPAPSEHPSVAPPGTEFPTTKDRFPALPFRNGMFGSPDLTVIAPDGRRLAADYIGLDGATGLSILRLEEGNLNVKNKEDE